MGYQTLLNILFYIRSSLPEPGNTIHYIGNKMESVKIVHNHHIERCARRSLFLITANMHIIMIGSTVCQSVNKPWIAVIGKNDRLVGGEDIIEIPVLQAVRMLFGRLKSHEINNVDNADLEVWNFIP